MKKLIAQRHTFRRNMIAVVCVFLTAYFMGNILFGDRSSERLSALNTQVSTLSTEVASLDTARLSLQNKVTRLRPNSIDPDMLEERARVVLGFDYGSERVLLNR